MSELFTAEDFSVYKTPDKCALDANARLAPLVAALEELDKAFDGKFLQLPDAICAVLTAYRALKEGK